MPFSWLYHSVLHTTIPMFRHLSCFPIVDGYKQYWNESPYEYIFSISLWLNRDLHLLCSKPLVENEKAMLWGIMWELTCTIPTSCLFLLVFLVLFYCFAGLNLALDSDWPWPWYCEQTWLRREAEAHKTMAERQEKAPVTWSTRLPALSLAQGSEGTTKSPPR